MTQEPLFPKDSCSGCVFLGTHLGRDLYVCSEGTRHEFAIVQYGASPNEYACYRMQAGKLSYDYKGTFSDSAREVVALLARRNQ